MNPRQSQPGDVGRRTFPSVKLGWVSSAMRIAACPHLSRIFPKGSTMKLPRRYFLHFAAGTASLPITSPASIAQPIAAAQVPLEPLVWPVVPKVPSDVHSFAGHTNTVPDIVGRFGAPASVVIFTEGNHLMVLHSDDILGAFPAWTKLHASPSILALLGLLIRYGLGLLEHSRSFSSAGQETFTPDMTSPK